jgi:hypothetical protein
MFVRKLQAVAGASLIFASFAAAALAQEFTDIKGNPYQSEIEQAVQMKIVAGFPNGTFRPNESITREQAISTIVDALNTLSPIDVSEQPTSRVRPFLDVDPSSWSAAKIAWAQWNIFPQGTATGNFRPKDYITRAELLAFLRRSAELVKVKMGKNSVLNPTQKPTKFTDVSGFNEQLTLQMSAYCGIASPLNEKGMKFAPNSPAKRDYTTAAIVRTLECVKQDSD